MENIKVNAELLVKQLKSKDFEINEINKGSYRIRLDNVVGYVSDKETLLYLLDTSTGIETLINKPTLSSLMIFCNFIKGML